MIPTVRWAYLSYVTHYLKRQWHRIRWLTQRGRYTVGHACFDYSSRNTLVVHNRVCMHSELVCVKRVITENIYYVMCGSLLLLNKNQQERNGQRLQQKNLSGDKDFLICTALSKYFNGRRGQWRYQEGKVAKVLKNARKGTLSTNADPARDVPISNWSLPVGRKIYVLSSTVFATF